MNIFMVWSLPMATQWRSGPRRAPSERELRVERATWKSLKNHRKTFSVRHRCSGAVTMACCPPGITWSVCGMHGFCWNIDWKTDRKARDMEITYYHWAMFFRARPVRIPKHCLTISLQIVNMACLVCWIRIRRAIRTFHI